MVRHQQRDPRCRHVQAAHAQVLRRRGEIAICNLHHVGGGADQKRPYDVVGQPRRGGPVELAWLFLGHFNQVGECIGFQCGAGRYTQKVVGHRRDRHEIAGRVVG